MSDPNINPLSSGKFNTDTTKAISLKRTLTWLWIQYNGARSQNYAHRSSHCNYDHTLSASKNKKQKQKQKIYNNKKNLTKTKLNKAKKNKYNKIRLTEQPSCT
jgi:hypothetical protein